MLVVPGRPRTIAKVVGARRGRRRRAPPGSTSAWTTRSTSSPGSRSGVAIPLIAFRFFTPNEVVPVTYHGGKTAHLDVGGRRGEALRRAVEDQLGVTVVDVQPGRPRRVRRVDAAAPAPRRATPTRTCSGSSTR